jgi:hypothetical protein
MLVSVLGWATVVATVAVLFVVLALLREAHRRPWRFRTRVRVPREVPAVQWQEDTPFPWI